METPRRYSDDEFARIVRRATELAVTSDPHAAASDGLTLAEMQSAAAQVGLDPALIARAAHLEVARSTPSMLERVVGGPVRHHHEEHVPLVLDEEQASHLLSAVRISASPFVSSNPGHASALGIRWDSSGEGDILHVTARSDADGTTLAVVIDRRGTMVLTALVALFMTFMVTLFGMSAIWPESHALGGVIAAAGPVMAFAVARRFWVTSSRKASHRAAALMETMMRVLAYMWTQGQTTSCTPVVRTIRILFAIVILPFATGQIAHAQRNCTKGIPCGSSCIAATKTCRKAPGTTGASTASPKASQQVGGSSACRVTRIVDGDTIECDRRKIRLLLIDTPERKQAPFGRQATAVLRRLAPVGGTVRLEFDVDRTDRYGRELAYVYTSDGRFINEAIAREGYAVPLVYPPNVRHVERIRAAYEAAKAARAGLWAVDAFSCLPADARRGRCE